MAHYFKAVLPPSIPDDIKKCANRLEEAVVFFGISIADDIRRKVLVDCIKHHFLHIEIFRVNQIAIDPYKIITGYGFGLAEHLGSGDERQRGVIKSTLRTLNFCIRNEHPQGGLDKNVLDYLEEFLMNELEEKKECGIGKNGLFMAFHIASMMKRRAERKSSKRWERKSAQ